MNPVRFFLFPLAAACALDAPRAQAPSVLLPPVAGRVEAYPYQAGPFTNASAKTTLAAEKLVRFPKASFLQIGFAAIRLSRDSRLEVVSLLDDEKEVWTSRSLMDGQSLESAYFNGEAVLIRLWTAPGSRGDGFAIRDVAVGLPADQSSVLSLCGADNRVLWSDKRVARIILKLGTQIGVCTAWLISPVNCFATAGHCLSGASLVTAEFNVPKSTSTGALVHPPVSEQYVWEGTANRSYENNGVGRDWGVFTTLKNSVTKRYPGSVQRSYFGFQSPPPLNSSVRVTGYGKDSTPDKTRNYIQQTDHGPLRGVSGSTLQYRVDTMGGDSGGPVIAYLNKAIGVHTHSACTNWPYYANVGTSGQYSPFVAARAKHSTRPALPDFRATLVAASSARLEAFKTYTFTGKIVNYGTAQAPAASHGFYISKDMTFTSSDILIASWSSPPLPVGTPYTKVLSAKVPATVPSQSCYLGLLADRTSSVKEEDEYNNVRFVPVVCVGIPDLQISVLSAASSANAGSSISVTVHTDNKGTRTAGPSLTAVLLSTNSVISHYDLFLGQYSTGVLGSGKWKWQTLSVRIPYATHGGTHYLAAWADHTNAVTEASETNNIRKRTISITGYSGAGRFVEFIPRWNTGALSPTAATIDASQGGKASMTVTAPQSKGYWYLLLWSMNRTAFRLDALTNFQLALLNSPIFMAWFGKTNTVTGQAYPLFAFPPGVSIPSAFTAYTYSAWFTPNLNALVGFGSNHIQTLIVR